MTSQIINQPLKKIEQLLASPFTIFTTQDLSTQWQISDETTLYSNINYYIRTKKLIRLHKGMYALSNKPWTNYELAQKLHTPSYLSFYTGLTAAGITFQHYETIHAMALSSKTITAASHTFTYHKIKKEIFYDQIGIEDHTTFKISSPERAICDSLYLAPSLSFDNLKGVDPNKLLTISKIYNNNRLEKQISQITSIDQMDKFRLT